MKRSLIIAVFFIFMSSYGYAATYYVDSAVGSSGNGLAWATAWKTIANITGVAAGDTVYFSGGADGKSHTASGWTPAAGTKANPIIYASGIDANHNGMVTFTGTGNFLQGNLTGVTINGEKSGAINLTIANTYTWTIYSDGSDTNGFKLLYANFTAPIWGRGEGYEIAYCSGIAPVDISTEDSYINHIGEDGTQAYGVSSIHHNYFQVWRRKTNGYGQDIIKWGASTDVYNNIFISTYSASYTGTQHNDAMQTAGSYYRVYNNYFENFISYPIYNEMYGNTTAWRIYNNVIYATESGVDWGAYQCMALGFSATGTISDYIVANNTCIGNASQNSIHFNTGVAGTVGSGCYIVNNLLYNSNDISVVGSPTMSNNYAGTTNISFVNNSTYPTGDFHPAVGSSNVFGQGTAKNEWFTTDKGGTTRGSVWDIGAYEYEAGAEPDYTLTVTKAGTGSGSVTSSPAGISCGATCTYDFDASTEVTLTATVDYGNAFIGWSGAGGCTGTGTCVLTMSEAKAATATFQPRKITFGGSGSITMGGSGSITLQ